MEISLDKNRCTGCTACAYVCPEQCIRMERDPEGFLYPEIEPERCVGCGLCEKTCPVLNKRNKVREDTAAYAAYSKDTLLRMESSSGGVFSELAKAVLNAGGVVFGAAYDETFQVRHIRVETPAELGRLRGAKYAQSQLDDTFREIKVALGAGQVLFAGTPCQVAGLKAYLGRDYEGLTTVDFICHSVPSPVAWREYVKYRAAQDNGGELPKAVNLRSKITGWSRYGYCILFEYAHRRPHIDRSGESLYIKLFVGGYISRPACGECMFKGYERISDITLGDFWGIWDIAPEMDDDKGTSLVLCHTDKGKELFEKSSAGLTVKRVSLEETSRQNSVMLTATQPNKRRAEALALITSGNIKECENRFFSVKGRSVQRLQRFLSRLLKRKMD